MRNAMQAALLGVALMAGACGPMDDSDASGAGLGTSTQALTMNDFAVGINAYDEHWSWFNWIPDTGETRWTPTLGTIIPSGSPGVSTWASDDHDNVGLNKMRIWFSKSVATFVVDGYDIRIGVAVKDWDGTGSVQYTPWLSEVQQHSAPDGWSAWAGDGADNRGFDYARMYLEVRTNAGFILDPHFRLGIRVYDGLEGDAKYTSFMNDVGAGSFSSGYATCSNCNDLDKIQVYIGP
jgi:hypothetical protein